MKYGKKYLETLASSNFPPEWQQTAIEYRRLKKVINRVAEELAALGLTSEVLRDLMQEQEGSNSNGNGVILPGGGNLEELADTASIISHEVVRGKSTEVGVGAGEGKDSSADESELSEKAKGKRKVRRRARASYEMAGTTDKPEPRIRLIFSSASSNSGSSDSDYDASHSYPLFQHVHHTSSDTDPSTQSGPSSSQELPSRFAEVDSEDDKNVTEDKVGDDEDASSTASLGIEEVDFEGAGMKESTLLKKMYGVGEHSDDERDFSPEGEERELRKRISRRNSRDTIIDVERRRSSETVRWVKEDAAASTSSPSPSPTSTIPEPIFEEPKDFGLEADDEGLSDSASVSASPSTPVRRKKHHHRQPRKEVFIPLNSDTEFLTLLAQALASIAALQIAQKLQFTQSVALLSREVQQVSSPSRPKTDLYVWREIFALWVEAQIFESSREKDRGERSTDDVEEKLDWFVDQVAKRKLAKKMRHKESKAALEKFIKLNVELLDMKRFQLANEEAARKILKKHDKRTALTASAGFPQFISAASSLSLSKTPNSTLSLSGLPSLPHILLSTFTDTLLPIIPQLEDYECSICGDVAFKPIKLDCTHNFCVRCLVKMQKRGQNACPQCRAPVVLRANAANLDHVLQSYLEMWFPKEIKAKRNQNKIEAGKEEAQEMGMGEQKCIIC